MKSTVEPTESTPRNTARKPRKAPVPKQYTITLSAKDAAYLERIARRHGVTAASMIEDTVNQAPESDEYWNEVAEAVRDEKNDETAETAGDNGEAPGAYVITLDPEAEKELRRIVGVWRGLTAESLIGSLASHDVLQWEHDDDEIRDLDIIRSLQFQINEGVCSSV